MRKALVIIDIQNDITKNYKDIIGNINNAIDWAVNQGCTWFISGTRIYPMAHERLNPIHVERN